MDLPFQLDKQSGVPLYVQMEQQFQLFLGRGVVRPGDLMPTVRALAVALEINANTVARVYRDLQQAGLLVLKRGVGTFVADDAPKRPWKPADLAALEQKVAELVETARQCQISGVELLQFVESRWKEVSDADR
jgi:GntR family transcriptional regulator